DPTVAPRLYKFRPTRFTRVYNPQSPKPPQVTPKPPSPPRTRPQLVTLLDLSWRRRLRVGPAGLCSRHPTAAPPHPAPSSSPAAAPP
uniref:Uncharacterized protein n=1 Tax=Aegilops tauschii subsp. strangulata TaxID=200361 RepID=A0A453PXI9_AEGTS